MKFLINDQVVDVRARQVSGKPGKPRIVAGCEVMAIRDSRSKLGLYVKNMNKFDVYLGRKVEGRERPMLKPNQWMILAEN